MWSIGKLEMYICCIYDFSRCVTHFPWSHCKLYMHECHIYDLLSVCQTIYKTRADSLLCQRTHVRYVWHASYFMWRINEQSHTHTTAHYHSPFVYMHTITLCNYGKLFNVWCGMWHKQNQSFLFNDQYTCMVNASTEQYKSIQGWLHQCYFLRRNIFLWIFIFPARYTSHIILGRSLILINVAIVKWKLCLSSHMPLSPDTNWTRL